MVMKMTNQKPINKKSLTQTSIYKRLSKKRKRIKSRNEKIEEGVDLWTSFYRANPHRFVKDFLGIELKLFQQILLFVMMHFNFLTYIAARGQGKTYLTAIYCIVRMILYPKTKIIAAAGLKSQGQEIVAKIKEIANDAPLLKNELAEGMKSIRDSANDPRVEMKGNSWLRVVAANDGARGKRANLLIVDEYRLVPVNVIDTVLRKMQADPRQPGFLNKPEYKGNKKYIERNKQIYLSSAWYKAHEAWDRVLTYNDNMLAGQSYFGCAIPYQISIMEGLKSEDEVQDEMSERTFNEVTWSMEMEAMFWGQNQNSFFEYEEIQKNRVLAEVYYPKEIRELLGEKVLKLPKKKSGEIRVIAADVAVMGGTNNDATVFTVASCLPTKEGYERSLMYIESHDGGHTNILANRIRQLFADFECDYLVLDTGGIGVPIYDQLTINTIDPERGTKYEPWTCFNNDDMAKRCIYHDAKPVVYSIKGNSELNSNIAQLFKDTLRKGMFKLPVHEDETRDTLEAYEGYKSLEKEYQLELKLPYVQTTIMATEILNLEDENAQKGNGVVKIKESRSARKDKYSSISYLNYFVSEYLELHNRSKNNVNINPSEMFMIKQAKTRASRGGVHF